ncbi:MAG: cytochrome-c peroxidase [Gammaproteobacteria bacterium]|nr:cytochrome-c peroxidase [Gammaproteobacteria bacterium]MDE0366047.1 cytochrome-c peroxidase [Gammaproteobacteria bacterium]
MPPATLRNLAAVVILALTLGAVWALFRVPLQQPPWTEKETGTLQSLWLGSLPPLPEETGNPVADDPRAQRLGHRLFFDPRLSANGQVSCATCHQPARRFADAVSLALGLAVGDFNTMSLVGAAYSPWLFWDGRRDSLWSQALSPLESPLEQGAARTSLARLVAADTGYRERYSELFGPVPDLSDRRRFPEGAGPNGNPESEAAWTNMTPEDRETVTAVFVNLGKAIAAYERLLLPGATDFDRYVENLEMPKPSPAGLSRRETEGLRLFMGKAQCLNCHNGPLFTNHEFHNTGVLPPPGRLPDKGRVSGVEVVLNEPFNCLGTYNDPPERNCAELRFARTGAELTGARKTPSLRNLGGTDPFMHAGQMRTIAEVLDHYNRARPAIVGHNEAKPLNLLPYELKRLEAFLLALDGPMAVAPEWLAPPADYSTMSPTF